MRNGFIGAVIAALLLTGCMEDRNPLVASVSPQQEDVDRAACHAEGAAVTDGVRPATRPGEYDLFKNMATSSREEEASQVEKRCMVQRGYKPPPPEVRKGLFNRLNGE